MTHRSFQVSASPSSVPTIDDQTSRQMAQLVCGKWIVQAIHVAAVLNIAKLLESQPRSIADLASATKTQPDMLRRLLRSLAGVGVFATDKEGRYQLTPLAEKLRPDVPGSMRQFAIMQGGELTWGAYSRLLDAVRTGETAFQLFHRTPFFEYLAKNPEAAGIFDEAMRGVKDFTGAEAIGAYDFSEITTLADIGGGHGQMLKLILQAYPGMKGILFDLPHAIAAAQPFLAAAGVADRVTLTTGDFFQHVPQGADAYMLVKILHAWKDEKAITLLRKIRSVVPAHGRLLVVEALITEDNSPSFAKFLDIEMMALSGGCERTEGEYERLFSAAGFRMSLVVGYDLCFQLLEGLPC